MIIMSDKVYQIQNGAVTLYVDMKSDGTTFEFKGFTVNGDRHFYQPYISAYDNGVVADRPHVGLNQYLFDKYKMLADEQIQTYLDQHIRDMCIYTDHGEEFRNSWYNAGKEPVARLYKSIRYGQVIDGIVGLELNGMICLYDFVSSQTVGFRKEYTDEALNVTPMYIFYGGFLTQKLAFEQYKRGFAPPFYVELAKLNQFLTGKKSVKLVMKNGNVHEYKQHCGYEVSIYHLLRFDPENISEPFLLENSYDLKPRFAGNSPVTELDYLQHGRDKHYIDPNALKNFG
jgi:hypothetical protein